MSGHLRHTPGSLSPKPKAPQNQARSPKGPRSLRPLPASLGSSRSQLGAFLALTGSATQVTGWLHEPSPKEGEAFTRGHAPHPGSAQLAGAQSPWGL